MAMPRPINLAQVQNQIVDDVAPGELIGLYPYPAANFVLEDRESGILVQPQPWIQEQLQPGMQEQPSGQQLDEHYTHR